MKITIDHEVKRTRNPGLWSIFFGGSRERNYLYLTIQFNEEERHVLKNSDTHNVRFMHRTLLESAYDVNEYDGNGTVLLNDLYSEYLPVMRVEIACYRRPIDGQKEEERLRKALEDLKEHIRANTLKPPRARDYEL